MSAQLALTVDPLADCIAWKRKNPEAWAAVVGWAHADRANGIAPSTRLYCCLLRRPHFAALLGLRRAAGSPVLVNDHIYHRRVTLRGRGLAMSVDPHVHCASCQTVIETKIHCRGGKTKDRELHVVGQLTVMPTPDGIGVVNRPVPLCDECFGQVEQQQQAKPSRLVVPGRGPL